MQSHLVVRKNFHIDTLIPIFEQFGIASGSCWPPIGFRGRFVERSNFDVKESHGHSWQQLATVPVHSVFRLLITIVFIIIQGETSDPDPRLKISWIYPMEYIIDH